MTIVLPMFLIPIAGEILYGAIGLTAAAGSTAVLFSGDTKEKL